MDAKTGGEHLLKAAWMAEADRITIARGASGYALMVRAGSAVAVAARRMTQAAGQRQRIAVICGRGNNGGDGYVAARLLRDGGDTVEVMAPLGPPQTADAAQAAADWGGHLVAEEKGLPDLGGYDLIVDAMFGAGLNRPLAGTALAIVQLLNASGRPVLAVDAPSGLNADTGQVMGQAVQARATVTFAARKPVHVLLPGRVLCGVTELADIGVAPETVAKVSGKLFRNTPDLWLPHFPVMSPEAHKYRRGHVLCGSGGVLSTGASRLSARGALRIGAGLVTVAADAGACRVHATHLTAIMLREVEGAADFARLLDDVRFNAVILGPGGGVGPDMIARVTAVAEQRRALVIDADAITSFAGRPDLLAAVLASAASGGAPVIMTPHDGEFARVFGAVPAVTSATSKYERALAAARLGGAVIILKGADTVIASPDGRAAINDNAPPWLGTAGAGDVLAGFVGGLLAQGMPGFEAACAGVWIHGAAARRFGPGLIAEDLSECVPAVLRDLLPDAGQNE